MIFLILLNVTMFYENQATKIFHLDPCHSHAYLTNETVDRALHPNKPRFYIIIIIYTFALYLSTR